MNTAVDVLHDCFDRGKITVQLDKWINPLESRSLGPVAVSVGGTLILPCSVTGVSFQ